MIRTITMLALTAVLLAGCGGSDDKPAESAATSEAPAASSQIPSPSAPEGDELVQQLDAIAPGLATEPDDTIANARNTCSSILGGGQNLQAATVTRFSGDGVETLTPEQADKIADTIKAAPWCK